MSAFEDFITLELPERPVMLLPSDVSDYDGDPTDTGNTPAKLDNAPDGSFYLQTGQLWVKDGGTWIQTGSDLQALADGSAAAPSIAFASDTDTGIFLPAVGQLGIAGGGDLMVGFGPKQFTAMDDTTVTAFQEWFSEPNGTDTEQAAAYFKIDTPDWDTNDQRYALYIEQTGGALASGAAIKIRSDSLGDSVYVAQAADQSITGSPSGGIAFEGALFGNGSTAFLASLQGTEVGLATPQNPVQPDCIGFQGLTHNDGTDPTPEWNAPFTRGFFLMENAWGNDFTARMSEFVPATSRAFFRITDTDFNNVWEARGDGTEVKTAVAAASGDTENPAGQTIYRSTYWDGSASQFYDTAIIPDISGGSSPSPTLSFQFTQYVSGSPQAGDVPLALAPDAVTVGADLSMGGNDLDMGGGEIAPGGDAVYFRLAPRGGAGDTVFYDPNRGPPGSSSAWYMIFDRSAFGTYVYGNRFRIRTQDGMTTEGRDIDLGDAGGNGRVIFDDDGDTYWFAQADDQAALFTGGSRRLFVSTSTLTLDGINQAMSGGSFYLQGGQFVFDSDFDTYLQATADDQLDLFVGGNLFSRWDASGWDFQSYPLSNVAGITLTTSGGNLDMQLNQIVQCTGLTMNAVGGNIDLQGGFLATGGGGVRLDADGDTFIHSPSDDAVEIQAGTSTVISASQSGTTSVGRVGQTDIYANNAVKIRVGPTNIQNFNEQFDLLGAGQGGAGLFRYEHDRHFASGASGASVTIAGALPADYVVLGVTVRVQSTLGTTSGTTGFQVGTAGDPDKWGNVTGTATGTTADSGDWTDATPLLVGTTAQDLVITANGGNFDGTGNFRVSVVGYKHFAPTA